MKEVVNPNPLYENFKVYTSQPSTGDNKYVRLFKTTIVPDNNLVTEDKRSFNRIMFSFMCYNGYSNYSQNIGLVNLFLFLNPSGNLIVEANKRNLFQISYLPDLHTGVKIYYKKNTTTGIYDIEVYLKLDYNNQVWNVKPIIFDQMYRVWSNYNPSASTTFSKSENVDYLLEEFPSFTPISETSLPSTWTLDTVKDVNEPIVSVYNGSTSEAELSKGATVLRIASSGNIGNLNKIIPYEGDGFYGKRIVLEIWNDNTTIVSVDQNVLEDHTSDMLNRIVLKNNLSRLGKKGDVLELVYLQNKWFEV